MARFHPALPLLAALPGVASADVWIVDDDGGADFATIQEAVDAAGDGDLILVYPGEYSSFAIDGKDLAVAGLPRESVVRGVVEVRNLPAWKQVVLSDLDVFWTQPLRVQSCAGPVRLQGCHILTEANSIPAFLAQASLDVAMVDVRIRGLYSSWWMGSPAGHGAELVNSIMSVFGSSITGGRGYDGEDGTSCLFCDCEDGSDGGSGIVAPGSFVYVAGSRLSGGNKGLGGSCFCAFCYDGYDGLAVDLTGSGAAVLRDCAILGPVSGTPMISDRPTRRLLAQTLALEGSDVELVLRGQPGDRVSLLVSRRGQTVYLPQAEVPLMVAKPWNVLQLGPLDERGQLRVFLPVSVLAPGADPSVLHLQAEFSEAGQGPRHLSNPRVLQVLATGHFPDCNANGFPDDLEINLFRVEDCNANGVPDPCDLSAGWSFDVDGDGLLDECETTLFVDADNSAGLQDGSSWDTAFANLQDALGVARASGLPYVNVWTAEGVYRPTGKNGSRLRSFVLGDGVRLFGGFAGDEVALEERDPWANVTVLSGDLKGDDGPDFANRDDNSSSVVRLFDTGAKTRIDGLVVTAAEVVIGELGGAVQIIDGTASIANTRFVGNRGKDGGGLRVGGGSIDPRPLVVYDCIFLNNECLRHGGGAYLDISQFDAAVLAGCRFLSNRISGAGGGLYVRSWGDLTVVNCLFHDNQSVGIFAGAAMLLDCQRGAQRVSTCTFADNLTDSSWRAGGLHITGASTELDVTNSIFWRNSAGGALSEGSNLHVSHALGFVDVDHCCIQDLSTFAGSGNIGGPPLFVDSDGPDDRPGTLDDDYRLLSGSPCIDSGRDAGLPDDLIDLNRNGLTVEPWPFDLEGHRREVDDPTTLDTGVGAPPIVDRGAYEKGGG